MDYSLTAEQQALRKEFEEFFQDAMKEAPKSWKGGVEAPFISDEHWAFHRKVARMLAKKGWLTRTWPKEYGGLSAPHADYVILNEAAGYHRCPGIDAFGLHMIGTLIIKMGTAKQKEFFLPRIANAEIMWCQGWSEPDAGSDLSSVSTQAVRDGDYYIVNGQKTWTSSAHRADWIFLVVRTDPDSKGGKGLSVLLVDLTTPGITRDPFASIDGKESFNDVFFDNVKVPVENRLGEENKGWQVTRSIMNLERMGMASDVGLMQRELEDLIAYCRETMHEGDLLINNPICRRQLAERAIEIKISRSLCFRLTWLVEKGEDPITSAYASALKAMNSETGSRLANTGGDIIGLYSQVSDEYGENVAPLKGTYEQLYLTRPGLNIAGGTSEIQRNIIAWTALDLPRK